MSASSDRARTPSCRSLRADDPPPGGVRGHHPREAETRRVEIGKPERTYTVEPVEDPVPRESPAPAPDEAPAETPPEPEEVPAR
jgi:hypothetical protein